ncbi:hypothetical protein FOXG_19054 [Fusarium oxysporum f. sp. lycopersici 4287]|uniref:Uncharacterized protein n=1 Tax=Fusarium oxysporum f. sp. lycopersici (strain 4287 / CBS 123668 / FGSC 9935 / NRRL 34936) TaxID=426428 RepID=A0A0J9UVR9_FUSO4|nr:hypothetical protein FOXG_19054 [Fusarium oxysporum f. sp. lycopersici 4287]KNB02616.1 hypothetical protein FOXG_19054 [Fusarium oxysporum f. sp. lycopersici 4287]
MILDLVSRSLPSSRTSSCLIQLLVSSRLFYYRAGSNLNHFSPCYFSLYSASRASTLDHQQTHFCLSHHQPIYFHQSTPPTDHRRIFSRSLSHIHGSDGADT